MSFIDPVHAEGLIQPGIWAGILLWGSKCVLSLCFAPILNRKYILRTNLSGLCRRGIAFPSECQLQQHHVRVVQHQCTLREESGASTERIEEPLHSPLQFTHREVGVSGKQPIAVMILISGWSFLVCRACWRQPHGCPDSTRLLYPTKMISARLWAWYGWKWDWQCPQSVSHLHMQQWVIRRLLSTSLLHFFLIYCPLGKVVDHFGAHYQEPCLQVWENIQFTAV